MGDLVVISKRQMKGSAPANRTFHRPTCPSLKTRGGAPDDTKMPRAVAVEAGYKPCERCEP